MAKVWVDENGKVLDVVLTGAGYGSGNVWHSCARLQDDGFYRGSVMCLEPAAVGYKGSRDKFCCEAIVLDTLAARLAEKIGGAFMFTFSVNEPLAGYCYTPASDDHQEIGSVEALLS